MRVSRASSTSSFVTGIFGLIDTEYAIDADVSIAQMWRVDARTSGVRKESLASWNAGVLGPLGPLGLPDSRDADPANTYPNVAPHSLRRCHDPTWREECVCGDCEGCP